MLSVKILRCFLVMHSIFFGKKIPSVVESRVDISSAIKSPFETL